MNKRGKLYYYSSDREDIRCRIHSVSLFNKTAIINFMKQRSINVT